ncbi:MAG: putative asparagine synthase, partial [Alphaproteobacteria bacterium]|nr:putative asparagine synthase [Alphaproteobacteria bacterium]
MRAAFTRDSLFAAVEPGETEHEYGPLRLLIAGRLHYRAPGGGSDAAVALEAYRRAGLAGLARLEGDFSLLLIDGERRRLVALRDPMGAYPLFWRRTPDGWAIGSSLAGLPGIADAPLDPAWLARRLIRGSASAGGEDSTAFAGLARLPPGRTASFGFGAGYPLLGPAFDWTARIQCEAVGNPASAAADYRARIEAAVGERLDGGVAAHVSGGMDSSAIALLAARAADRVDGLALLFDASETLRQEGDFVELVRDPRLHLHRLRGETDFTGWNAIAPHAEPTPWLFRTGQDLGLIAAAARAGARTILTGEGADEILAVPPLEILDWALRLRLRRAHREASNWALATGTTSWRVLASLGADRLPFRAAPHPPAWIQPDFARTSGWRRAAGREGMAERSRSPGLVLAHLLAQIARMTGDWANEAIAHPQRIHIAHPFRDPRVIAFGAAARLKFGADPVP